MPLRALPLSGSSRLLRRHLGIKGLLTSKAKGSSLFIIVMRPEPDGLSRDPRGPGVFPGRASNLGTPSCGSPMIHK